MIAAAPNPPRKPRNPRTPRTPRTPRAPQQPRRLRRSHPRLEPQVLARARWLPPADTALLEAYYADGLTIRRIAEMLDDSPRAVSRRLRILVERIHCPRFLAVARAAHPDPELRRLFGEPDPNLWTPTRKRVADAVYIRGLNMRHASQHLHLSLHTVRRHIDAINAIVNASTTEGARS